MNRLVVCAHPPLFFGEGRGESSFTGHHHCRYLLCVNGKKSKTGKRKESNGTAVQSTSHQSRHHTYPHNTAIVYISWEPCFPLRIFHQILIAVIRQRYNCHQTAAEVHKHRSKSLTHTTHAHMWAPWDTGHTLLWITTGRARRREREMAELDARAYHVGHYALPNVTKEYNTKTSPAASAHMQLVSLAHSEAWAETRKNSHQEAPAVAAPCCCRSLWGSLIRCEACRPHTGGDFAFSRREERSVRRRKQLERRLAKGRVEEGERDTRHRFPPPYSHQITTLIQR